MHEKELSIKSVFFFRLFAVFSSSIIHQTQEMQEKKQVLIRYMAFKRLFHTRINPIKSLHDYVIERSFFSFSFVSVPPSVFVFNCNTLCGHGEWRDID